MASNPNGYHRGVSPTGGKVSISNQQAQQLHQVFALVSESGGNVRGGGSQFAHDCAYLQNPLSFTRVCAHTHSPSGCMSLLLSP